MALKAGEWKGPRMQGKWIHLPLLLGLKADRWEPATLSLPIQQSAGGHIQTLDASEEGADSAVIPAPPNDLEKVISCSQFPQVQNGANVPNQREMDEDKFYKQKDTTAT